MSGIFSCCSGPVDVSESFVIDKNLKDHKNDGNESGNAAFKGKGFDETINNKEAEKHRLVVLVRKFAEDASQSGVPVHVVRGDNFDVVPAVIHVDKRLTHLTVECGIEKTPLHFSLRSVECVRHSDVVRVFPSVPVDVVKNCFALVQDEVSILFHSNDVQIRRDLCAALRILQMSLVRQERDKRDKKSSKSKQTTITGDSNPGTPVPETATTLHTFLKP